MNLSNVLEQTDFILPPDKAEMALLSLIGTVDKSKVTPGTRFLRKLSLAH